MTVETMAETPRTTPISGYEKELAWIHMHDGALRRNFPGHWIGVGRFSDSALYVAIGCGFDEMYRLCESMGIKSPATYHVPMSLSEDGLVHTEP